MELYFKIEVLKSVSEEKLKIRKSIIETKKQVEVEKKVKEKKLLVEKVTVLNAKLEALKDYQRSILI